MDSKQLFIIASKLGATDFEKALAMHDKEAVVKAMGKLRQRIKESILTIKKEGQWKADDEWISALRSVLEDIEKVK